MRFAKEGWPFVLPFLLLAALLLAAGHAGWASAAAIAGLGVLAFFRDPQRSADSSNRSAGSENPDGAVAAVLSPANGLVTGVDTVEAPDVGPGRYHRIVTFLSVFDVHVQRVPAGGEVIASHFAAGRKVAAFRADAGQVNEQHLTVIRRPNGDRIGVRQIAGLLARRVVCHLALGQQVKRGQTLGLIKFGSRVDLLVPATYELLVKQGDRLRDGVTLVAETAGAAAGAAS